MSQIYSPVSAYRQTTVRTASQGKLIVMLYDEAVRQLDSAQKLLQDKSKKLDQVHNSLVKTQDILTELMVGLDLEKGGELAQNLMNIYIYLADQVKEANLKKDPVPLNQVKVFLQDLRSAWAQIAGKAADVPEPTSVGVNIAG